MATKTSQRVGIWIIAGVMLVGTLGAFFLPILVNDSASKESEEQQKALAEYQKQLAKQQPSGNAEPLDGYAAEKFNPADVTELKIEELKAGEGSEATATSKLTVNYFGWTSDGQIFDSSKKGGTTTPIEFGLDGVIKGWTEGLNGAKAGSIRKLTIPSNKAYGEAGRPPTIGANQPLMFVVEVKEVK